MCRTYIRIYEIVRKRSGLGASVHILYCIIAVQPKGSITSYKYVAYDTRRRAVSLQHLRLFFNIINQFRVGSVGSGRNVDVT